MNKLKKGNIIILLEDIIIPGTGTTFYYYKGNKYRIKRYLDKWNEPAWYIKLIRTKEIKLYGSEDGYFSEKDLLKKFDCVKYSRKLKLKKLKSIYEKKQY